MALFVSDDRTKQRKRKIRVACMVSELRNVPSSTFWVLVSGPPFAIAFHDDRLARTGIIRARAAAEGLDEAKQLLANANRRLTEIGMAAEGGDRPKSADHTNTSEHKSTVWRSFIVFVITAVFLHLTLSSISWLGGKAFVVNLSKEAENGLHELQPQALALRYLAHLNGNCGPADVSMQAKCPNFGALIAGLVGSFFQLIGDVFTDGFTKASIELLQLLAGAGAAIKIMSLLDGDPMSAGGALALIFLTLLMTTLLALPIAALVWLCGEVFDHILPAPSAFPVTVGSLLSICFAVGVKFVENELHHGVGSIVEKALDRRGK
jgi:hypothetical protein